jgi:hypothetical protein
LSTWHGTSPFTVTHITATPIASPPLASGKPEAGFIQFVLLISTKHLGNITGHAADDLKIQILGIMKQFGTQCSTNENVDSFSSKDSKPFDGISRDGFDFLPALGAVPSIFRE